MRSFRVQAALYGGLLIGVLSSLPFVSALNNCCCLWVIVGGVLTTYLMQANAQRPVLTSDGAVSGLMAGAVGAVLASVLGLLIDLARGRSPSAEFDDLLRSGADLPPEVVTFFERLRELPVEFWYIVPFLLTLVFFPVFGMLGGLLGVAMFKKNAPPPPPPGTVEVLPPE